MSSMLSLCSTNIKAAAASKPITKIIIPTRKAFPKPEVAFSATAFSALELTESALFESTIALTGPGITGVDSTCVCITSEKIYFF